MKINRIIAIASLLLAVSCYRIEVQKTAYGSLQMSMQMSDQTKAFTDEDLYNSGLADVSTSDEVSDYKEINVHFFEYSNKLSD